jgi:acetyl-CoA carboxylase biotin carboxyl carrier protein
MNQDVSAPGQPAGEDLPARDQTDRWLGLEELQRTVLRLFAEFQRPPIALRVRVGDLAVEAEWPAEPTGAPAGVVAPAYAGNGHPPTAVAAVAEPDHRHYVRAPTVGVFYEAPEPGAQPFVSVGDTVVAGQQIGIVEAMKLMIPVTVDRTGRIVEVLKPNGAQVEYDDRLFALAADGS